MALGGFQVEVSGPVIQPGFAQGDLRVEQGCQFRDIEERVLQAITEMVLQSAAEHALIERRMEGQ
ncbi:hypothetical protein D3C79_948780 [compost metagenome]